MQLRKFSFISLLFFSFLQIAAQEKREPAIPFETLFGNERVNMALSVNKTIQGKFRYINSTSVAAYYDNKKGATEMVSINSIVFQFHKNFGVSTGMQYHFAKGFMPNLGLHLSYVRPSLLLALTPYYNFMPWDGVETTGVVEFKPLLGENLRLFTRAQGMYGHNLELNDWARGFVNLRLGLSFQRYTIGFGSNLDYYNGPKGSSQVKNFGGFVRVDI